MSEEKGPLYVYCKTCDKLLAVCYETTCAYAAETAHREHGGHEKCTVTLGYRVYFEKNFPQLNMGSSKVLLTVSGGVVDLVEKPMGIDVEIRDYDIEDCWDEDNERCIVDEDGERCQVMQWTSIVQVP